MLLAHAEPVAFFGDGQASPLFYGDGLAAPCGHVWTPSLLVMLLQRAPALRSLAVDGCPTLASGTPATPFRLLTEAQTLALARSAAQPGCRRLPCARLRHACIPCPTSSQLTSPTLARSAATRL